jgi:hypothetical protein
MKTHSEKVFESICSAAGYVVESLPVRNKEALRTADFRISSGCTSFIAEVEEICANKNDLHQIQQFQKNRSATIEGRIGSRARKHIREAADQLKAHVEEQIPLVIVLYNNIRPKEGLFGWPCIYLEPHDISAAMFGDRIVHVPLGENTRARPDKYGGGRTLTADQRLYISAVAVISDYNDSSIDFYHNHFASIPLPRIFFDGPQFDHFIKSRELSARPWAWERSET